MVGLILPTDKFMGHAFINGLTGMYMVLWAVEMIMCGDHTPLALGHWT